MLTTLDEQYTKTNWTPVILYILTNLTVNENRKQNGYDLEIIITTLTTICALVLTTLTQVLTII